MHKLNWNRSWIFGGPPDGFSALSGRQSTPAVRIDLPHDAMVTGKRDPDAPGGNASGFFRGDTYYYRKNLVVDDPANEVIILEFEGIQMLAQVYVNGQFAASCPGGYTGFFVELGPWLRPGANEIRVVARTGAEPNSRWYTGGGIYRDVNIYRSGLLYIPPEGSISIRTPQADKDLAVVETAVTIRYAGLGRREAALELVLRAPDGGVVGRERQNFASHAGETLTLRSRITLDQPLRWSPETPHLYRAEARLVEPDGSVADAAGTNFGIRRLELDSTHGLRINGRVTKLRGACIHHDNGVVGAATFRAAEERRVRLLKEAGFNAIRMAHHPASKALLDACDRHGMLVMDELTDMWNRPKSDYDHGHFFGYTWQSDIARMVAKDENHPSVILYSIGNEISELGTDTGVRWSRKIADEFRRLDPTRYTTNGTNLLLAVIDRLPELMVELGMLPGPPGDTPEGELNINQAMTDFQNVMRELTLHQRIGELTEQSYAAVDVAGYNYAHDRYEPDHETYPNRIIVGSETWPPIIDKYWALVEKHPWLLGDFTWTGWDYLGESGVGGFCYEGEGGFFEPFPFYLAFVGDIDITGERRPMSYLREIVYGLRGAPYIAVLRPEHYGTEPRRTPWAMDDAVGSWTWPGFEGRPVRIGVYSAAPEVELFLNGRSLGRQPAGPKSAFRCYFETNYEPGELRAVNCDDDGQSATLETAGPVSRIALLPESDSLPADPSGIAYVRIELQDAAGRLNPAASNPVSLHIEGAGTIQGFGTGDPRSETSFADHTQPAWGGKLLAVLRAGSEPGTICLTASSPGLPDSTIAISVEA